MKRKNALLTRTVLILMAAMLLLTAWVFVAPEKAEAATAGSYKWRVRVVSENDTGGWNSEQFRVYGCKNNGTSSQTSSAIASKDNWKVDFKGERTTTFGLGDQTTSEFPTKITYYYNFGGGATWRELRFYMYLEVWNNNNSTWVNIPLNMSKSGVSNELNLGANGGSGGNYEQRIQAKSSAFSAGKGTVTYTVNSKMPYASSVSDITGGSTSVNVPTDGTSTNTTNAFSTGTVKDQYGVNWYQDASLSVSSHTGVSMSSKKVAVTSDANASNDYTVTVTQTCGSASSTKTVTVKVFDYKVTFYDENGTTVLKSEQTVDYGGSATAPSNPTKASDSNKHYTFSSWTGDSYQTIKTGAQTRKVKASYTGNAHTASGWKTSSTQHWKECTTCSYITTAKANHSGGTATCTEKATCSTCSAKYGNVNSNNHNFGSASYSWSGTSSCTGTRTCSRDSSHKETASGTITSTVTTTATCTDTGVRTYTASFSSPFANQTKTEAIAKDPSNHASYGQTLDSSTVSEPTYDSAGYTGDEKCVGCGAVRTSGETIPKLESLISLDDVKLEDTALSGSCSIAPSVHVSDISYEIVGFSATGDHNLYKSTNKPDDGTTLKLSNARIRKTSASSFSYKFSSMDFTNLESFYVLVKVSGTNLHKYSVSDVYTYEKVTLVPPKNVMFDDASPAISFDDSTTPSGGYGQWVRIADSGSPVSSPAALDEFGDLATAQQSTENSVKYSFGDAHRVSVSNTLGTDWPTAQFTFTGSGFDVISVTDSNSGIFGVKVYQGTDTNVEKPYKSKIVDTYYGYTYTQLFYNQRTRKIVDSTDGNGTTLYAARSNTPEANRVYGGIGTYFYTMDEDCAVKDSQNNPVVAYGWLKSTSSDVLYQVPCLNMDLGAVGTYTVIVQPMFTDALGHYNESGDVKYYNFTLDGIRIYNPADGNNEALAMYAVNGETYTSYELVRETISDASLVVIDGKDQLDEQQLPGYLAGAPKNELYLKKNGTAAFDVNFTNLTDARIGLRALNGTACTVTISNGSGTPKTVQVTSATEQYVSLKPLLMSGSSSTITVTNGGDGILSITRLMTTSDTAPSTPSGAPRRYLSVGPNTAQVALETVEMLNADIAIDEETVETASTDDGTVTITLQTGEDAETIVIRDADGNVVDPDSIEFTIDEEGVKNWTIVLTESESGEYTYTLQAEYENGYTGNAEPTTVTVTVSFPEPEDTSIGGRLDKIKGFFERLIEFIRRIIKLFR